MNKRLRFTFVLPGSGTVPSGGHKVVYEYANGLVDRGHSVSIVQPSKLDHHPRTEKILRSFSYVYKKVTRTFGPDGWFSLDPRVHLLWVPTLRESYIPDADFVVATAWPTAEAVAGFSLRKGRKMYLIQSLETWSGPEERVLETWRSPFKRIVIARWLQAEGDKLGVITHYIPNGLNFSAFGIDTKPEDRDPHRVLMLYHSNPCKGSKIGLEALEAVKARIPSLRVTLFGVPARPLNLPYWVEYQRTPEQQILRHLYNQAAIFVSPSLVEGWPLPPAEALMCGTALVASDIGGHQEYASHGQTALLAEPGKSDSLADRVAQLLSDTTLRVNLAYKGNHYIQQFTWDRAIDSFLHVAQD